MYRSVTLRRVDTFVSGVCAFIEKYVLNEIYSLTYTQYRNILETKNASYIKFILTCKSLSKDGFFNCSVKDSLQYINALEELHLIKLTNNPSAYFYYADIKNCIEFYKKNTDVDVEQIMRTKSDYVELNEVESEYIALMS